MCTIIDTNKITTTTTTTTTPSVGDRPVLQPTCNRVRTLDRRVSLKKIAPKTPPPPPPPPPMTAKAKPSSPRPAALKREIENAGLNSSSDRITLPKGILTRSVSTLERKKSKKWTSGTNVSNNNTNNAPSTSNGIDGGHNNNNNNNNMLLSSFVSGYSSSLITDAPGSIAAVRREHMAMQNAQRKMKIAHYGRSKSAKYDSQAMPSAESLVSNIKIAETAVLERRCTSVTPNSDLLYVAYHDEEWGVPVHDDKTLFELLVLSSAQVGSDWTSILRKRQDFRDAFSGFDAEIVANFTEKQMTTISTNYAIDISRVRAVVDNANRILEIKKEFGSLDKYIWGFVNGKPISPQYKFAHKIPVKTSKSEGISKDMVRRGFRTVGPTATHSFMQAAGLTNDHLITCFRHLECAALASRRTK